MLPQFKQDMWLLSREVKGYYAWAEKERWMLYQAVGRGLKHCLDCHDLKDPRQLVDTLFEDGLGLHPLLDIAFEAFARAEARLGMRFIPQNSNEERLTGHLISEMEAAIHLVSDSFTAKSMERYGEAKQIDFAYCDLSQGGHVEKETGGDLGLILSVDLPDRPKLVSYAAIQAKRLLGNTASLKKAQYDTLTTNFKDAAAYLFYDCDLQTLAPPMIMSASQLTDKKVSLQETESFSANQSYVFSNALPLSLWLVTQLSIGKAGSVIPNFLSALNLFRHPNSNVLPKFSRLAMVSIGGAFNISRSNEPGLQITLP